MELILFLLTLIFASFTTVDSQADTCQKNGTYNCIPGQSKVEGNCPGYCNWCPSVKKMRRCQTAHRSCIFTDKKVLSEHTTKTDCENSGNHWCGGRTIWECVQADPIRSACFKKHDVSACPTTHSDENSCNMAGCIWCTEGVDFRINKCFARSNTDTCPDSDTCCAQFPCKTGSFDATSCEAAGCRHCVDSNGIGRCNFPLPTAECPTGSNIEDCFAGLEVEPERGLCDEMGCVWCNDNGQPTCKRVEYPDSCGAGSPEPCPISELTSLLSCKSRGCEWCGPAAVEPRCRKSTECTTCFCAKPEKCAGKTAKACGLLGCLWCENPTTAGQCINLDAGGLTAATANQWTPCTRECGEGSRFRFKSCGGDNPLSCDREYETCNSEDCVLGVCEAGERPRYDDLTTCCQSHTRVCGRNSLNDDNLSGTKRRKKRVVGGGDIVTNQKWPWLVAIYFDMSTLTTTRCSGTLIGDKWVITAATCVSGKAASDSVVHLNTYDRNELPEIEAKVAAFHNHPDGNIALVELETPVTPYSPTVSPLCMPYSEEVKPDRKCVVAGWGRTVESSATSCSPTALDVTVRVMIWGLCELSWGPDLTSSLDPLFHFCAGIPEGGYDACLGDLGAPLMCERCEDCGWFLAGVASPHVGCGASLNPSVYYKVVGSVEEWVENQFTRLDPKNYNSCNPTP